MGPVCAVFEAGRKILGPIIKILAEAVNVSVGFPRRQCGVKGARAPPIIYSNAVAISAALSELGNSAS
jgi:hypothetical protein